MFCWTELATLNTSSLHLPKNSPETHAPLSPQAIQMIMELMQQGNTHCQFSGNHGKKIKGKRIGKGSTHKSAK